MQVSSAPNRGKKTTGWMRGFESTFGRNGASRLGWTGCLESGKEVGAGEATTTRVLMEGGGFGVMEGAFQRYTE